MHSTEIPLNTATIRELNSTEIDSNITARETGLRAITAPTYKHLSKPSTSKHSIEFTYSDFPCHFKVNRDKLALTNRRWMNKKGKRLTITANF